MLSKSEKSRARLKEDTALYRRLSAEASAFRTALALLEKSSDHAAEYGAGSQESARAVLAAVMRRIDAILPKLRPGTPQKTLAVRRIQAISFVLDRMRPDGEER